MKNSKLMHKIILVQNNKAVSTLNLIGDYISNLANAKNTVVSVIQNIFHFFIS